MQGCCYDKACTKDTCMDLPEGETCGTCYHLPRCSAFGFTSSAENKNCDFFPRRFHKKAAPIEAPDAHQG